MTMNKQFIWITGASSGLGLELSIQLHQLGANLILSGRNIRALEELKQSLGERHQILAFDLAEPEKIPEVADKAFQLFPKIDQLILCGGISQRNLFIESSLELDKKILDVDFFSNTELARAVIPQMIRNNGGRIVVVSSLAGKFGYPLRSAYSAAKHALHGYFETVRAELHDEHIKITIVNPGRIRTNISYNALLADGSPQGTMDYGQAHGMDAAKCARKIIKAIKHNKKEVYIGWPDILLIYIYRFIPAIYHRLIRKLNVR